MQTYMQTYHFDNSEFEIRIFRIMNLHDLIFKNLEV